MANEFNRTYFNRIEQVTIVDAAYDMAASMNGSFQAGVKVFVDYQLVSEMTAYANLGYCYLESYEMEAEMEGVASVVPTYSPSGVWEQDMEMTANYSLLFTPQTSFSGWITARANASAVFYPEISFTQSAGNAMTARFLVRRTYFPNGLYGSSMVGDFEAVQIVEDSMIFPSLSLPRNGVLIIDGPGYNITRNGVNALAAYTGHWLDIGRNFVGMDVNSQTSGNLTVTVRYQEMFL